MIRDNFMKTVPFYSSNLWNFLLVITIVRKLESFKCYKTFCSYWWKKTALSLQKLLESTSIISSKKSHMVVVGKKRVVIAWLCWISHSVMNHFRCWMERQIFRHFGNRWCRKPFVLKVLNALLCFVRCLTVFSFRTVHQCQNKKKSKVMFLSFPVGSLQWHL